ncbi:MAG: DUF3467 domain-containing protein [Sedimentitalea sp.]|uniref:DUF3467 domain-containing protein n=1 Tax=Sedimentitalea sp. TaxID=2048915 RepID=UPI003265296B
MTDETVPGNNGRMIVAGYANYFEVGHNAYEFLLDFGQVDPQRGKAVINRRFALGPTHAKLLMRLMTRSVAEFEQEFGPIADVRDDDPLASVLNCSPEFERRAEQARRKTRAERSGTDAPTDR